MVLHPLSFEILYVRNLVGFKSIRGQETFISDSDIVAPGDATQRNILIGFGSLMGADKLHGAVYIRWYKLGQQTACNGYHNRVRESGQGE